MKIEITQKSDGTFLADPVDLAGGNIPIGNGPDKRTAIGDLIYRLSKEVPPMGSLTWMQKYYGLDIDFKEFVQPPHEELAEQMWDNTVVDCGGW